jgi:hypothetical protein
MHSPKNLRGDGQCPGTALPATDANNAFSGKAARRRIKFTTSPEEVKEKVLDK